MHFWHRIIMDILIIATFSSSFLRLLLNKPLLEFYLIWFALHNLRLLHSSISVFIRADTSIGQSLIWRLISTFGHRGWLLPGRGHEHGIT